MKAFRVCSLPWGVILLTLTVGGCQRDEKPATTATARFKESLSAYKLTNKEIADSIPQHLGHPNLNALYAQVSRVAAVIPKGQKLSLEPKQVAANWTAIREHINNSKDQLALAHEIASHPEVAVRRNWRELLTLALPEFSAMRQAARILIMDALIKSRDQGRVAGLRALHPVTVILGHVNAEPMPIANTMGQAIERDLFNAVQVMLNDNVPPNALDRNEISALLNHFPALLKPGQYVVTEGLAVEPYADRPTELLNAVVNSKGDGNRPMSLNELPEISQASPAEIKLRLWQDVESFIRVFESEPATPGAKLYEIQKIETAISTDRRSIRAASRVFSDVASTYETYIDRLVMRDILKIVSENKSENLPQDPYSPSSYKVINAMGRRTIYSIGSDRKDDHGSVFADTQTSGLARATRDLGLTFAIPKVRPARRELKSKATNRP